MMKCFVPFLLVGYCLFADDIAIDNQETKEPISFETIKQDQIEPDALLRQSTSLNLDMPQDPPHFQTTKKHPLIAAGLSSLFPGLGHYYLGENKTATALLGSATLSLSGMFVAGDKNVRSSSNLIFSAISGYGVYAAYRDARNINGQSNYSYKMPTDSLSDLVYAPVNYKVLKKPAVWGGLLASLGMAVAIGHLVQSNESCIRMDATHFSLSPIAALPIAVSEESLFRGFLQSSLSEGMSPWAGITISSLLFGAAHIPNAFGHDAQFQRNYYTFVVPFLSVLGGYMGWMTYKFKSLKESVALHCLYDFIILAASAASQSACIGRPTFALALPF